MKIDFTDPEVKRHMFDAEFGLEKESLRVTPDGYLPDTTHPFSQDSNIQRDFCNAQTEIITGVHSKMEDVCRELCDIHSQAVRVLAQRKEGQEYIWPFSNPPYVKSDDDIAVADYTGEKREWKIYREYLAEKYGKKKMLYCGIHFNFSFADSLLFALRRNQDVDDLVDLKNQLYLDVSQKLMKYSWLIVYLTAASPLADGSFFDSQQLGKSVVTGYASSRCGREGYWNLFLPVLDYSDVESYVDSIRQYIKDGSLKAEKELYYPIRLKARGEYSLSNVQEKGIHYMEFRLLDVNPFSPYGIEPKDLSFVHYLILYLLSREESMGTKESMQAIDNIRTAALLDDEEGFILWEKGEGQPIRGLAEHILRDMMDFYRELDTERDVLPVLSYQLDKTVKPEENRYVTRLLREYGSDFVGRGMVLARENTQKIVQG